MQIETIDIDRYKIYDKTVLLPHIIKKIAQCPHLYKIVARYSASTNGIHIKIWCDVVECHICRMSYDDQNRLAYDLKLRPPLERNILFNKYTIIKNRKKITLTCSNL